MIWTFGAFRFSYGGNYGNPSHSRSWMSRMGISTRVIAPVFFPFFELEGDDDSWLILGFPAQHVL